MVAPLVTWHGCAQISESRVVKASSVLAEREGAEPEPVVAVVAWSIFVGRI